MKKRTKLLLPLIALLATVGGLSACELQLTPSTTGSDVSASSSETQDSTSEVVCECCTEHLWNKSYIFRAPTEDTDGEVLYVCDTCKLVKMEPITPDGDEDQDLLTNYEELVIYGTDPYKEDSDGDHLLDEEEVNLFHTNPAKADSDDDGINDFDEFIYETDPMNPDTDGDGLLDGKEIEYGFDPKEPQASFDVVVKPGDDIEDTVDPSLEIEIDGEKLNTLEVNPDDFFTEDTLGYMGKAYEYKIEGEIDNATISFEFDDTNLDPDADLVIYDFDSEKREMRPLPTTVEGNKASAEVDSLSTYILIDRRVYEEEFKWVDKWETGKNYSDIEIVFVIDDSGSMYSNDYSYERLSVAIDLINKLPEDSEVGVVRFASSTTTLTGLTSDKEAAKGYLTTSYFYSSGGTNMYSAINSSFGLYSNDLDTMRVMVVLSDGATSDTSMHNSVVNTANSKDVMVYTVGLGSSTSYFTSYLQPLASSTEAKFYYASQASELAEIYSNIKEKMDIQTDSDNDGLSDYYEDNMVVFAGIGYELDKTNPDTDGDGLFDGVEVKTVTVFNDDGTKMTILGRVFSDPTEVDSDLDGVEDKMDRAPLDPQKQ